MRTLAIGDIHGCLAALDTILEAVRPQPPDVIVTLGDYVDRGPDSRGVIERLLELDARQRLVPLRGNHELIMLDARRDARFWLAVGGLETLESYATKGEDETSLADIPASHWEFIEHRCLDWYETERYIFVHASVHPDLPMAEQDEFSLVWQAIEPIHPPHCSGKTVICGHTSQHNGEPLDLGHTICIDTWVYGHGWLTCLDVDRGHIWQANQHGLLRERPLRTK